MAEAKVLPQGIRFFDKNAKAPDFVLGSMVITIDELVQFTKDNPQYLTEYNGKQQLRLQVLKSQKGGIYANVDLWKPGVTGSQPVSEPANIAADSSALPF